MFPKAIHELSKPRVILILETIKCSRGMSVSELVKLLEMSYMGVKRLCVNLEDLGYLKTWRVPREEAGRPQLVYRLTAKCDTLFSSNSNGLSLFLFESMKTLYGDASPERLLYRYFEELSKGWKKSVDKGLSLIEKVTRLVEQRKACGYFCKCIYTPEDGLRIEEYHHPLEPVIQLYPSAIQVELQVLKKILGTNIRREEEVIDASSKVVVYSMSTL